MRNKPIITGGPEASKFDSDPGIWLDLVGEYRVGMAGSQKVVRATLRSDLDPDSDLVQEFLNGYPGEAHLSRKPGGDVSLVLVQRVHPPRRHRGWLHAGLFVATLLSTLGAGALMRGRDPFRTRIAGGPFGWGFPIPGGLDLDLLWLGAGFALPFLTILTCHEMGHFVAARLRKVEASLPYFLPFPPYYSVVGTLGAFIRLRGVLVRRSALLDVGASGPWASFVLSVVAMAWGLPHSTMVAGYAHDLTPFAIRFLGETIWLGSGVLSWILAEALLPSSPGGELILLHPVAFAGWLGLFITALNLLPLGQLDGGHVLYALLGEKQGIAARIFLALLVPLGFLWWGWWFWGVLAVVLGRGRPDHPPVLQPWVPLDTVRSGVAWATIFVFFVTLPPLPIQL